MHNSDDDQEDGEDRKEDETAARRNDTTSPPSTPTPPPSAAALTAPVVEPSSNSVSPVDNASSVICAAADTNVSSRPSARFLLSLSFSWFLRIDHATAC